METIIFIFQFIAVIAISPLISGFITKVKNNLRMRRGQSLFQPYYNLKKLFGKGEMISQHSSWIFRWAPFIVLASMMTALIFIPIIFNTAQFMGDAFALIFIFSIARFFIALAGLDTASAFGGMGSSREMFVSSLAEPAVFLAIFAAALRSQSTSLYALGILGLPSLSIILCVSALFLVSLAETSRMPIDNQETHLELTMIHEAMVLEYSGKSLALIELSSYIKQIIWFSLIGHILFPTIVFSNAGFVNIWASVFLFFVKLIVISLLIAFIEVSVAKMRLLRVIDYLGFAFVLSLFAVVSVIMGL